MASPTTTIDCIALRTVKVSETSDLLTVWSRQYGLLTIAVAAGKSKAVARRKALTTPLARFEAVVTLRPGADIAHLRSLSPAMASLALEQSPVKTSIAIFIGEFLERALRLVTVDESISDYLFVAVDTLAALPAEHTLNYHISFLAAFAHFVGIAPDFSAYRRGQWLDQRSGIFMTTPPLHSDALPPVDTRLLLAIVRTPLTKSHRLPIDAATRRAALDGILRYYSIHLALQAPRSLSILRTLAI